ncbi:hypothetical protein CLV31_1012 [Algoriphagus aquaeductus]|uniref:Uncharacterized protein n=1 Tax=Algoriphagus aquaeductus TaxID=475299 RepID=A0A326RZN3_9BACT|nr:hypothetical protein CLV31_1012 [Algoriphagus aquaeductus]
MMWARRAIGQAVKKMSGWTFLAQGQTVALGNSPAGSNYKFDPIILRDLQSHIPLDQVCFPRFACHHSRQPAKLSCFSRSWTLSFDNWTTQQQDNPTTSLLPNFHTPKLSYSCCPASPEAGPHLSTTRQPDNRTTRQLYNRTTRQPDASTSLSTGNRTTTYASQLTTHKLPNFPTPILPYPPIPIPPKLNRKRTSLANLVITFLNPFSIHFFVRFVFLNHG